VRPRPNVTRQIDWLIEHGLMSAPTQNRLYSRRMLLDSSTGIRRRRRPIWEIDWFQNKWPWHLRSFKVMSTIASHSPSNISETRLGSKGIGIGLQGIKWSRDRYMTSRDPERSNSWPPITLRASKCRKRLDLETPFQRTTNRKGLLGNGQSQTAVRQTPFPAGELTALPRPTSWI